MWRRDNQYHRSERGSQSGFPLLTPTMETYDSPAWRLISTLCVQPHRGALDRLPFQGFARRSGIQVFRLYSRASPVTEIAMEAGRQGRTRMEGGKAHRKCVRCMRGLCCGFVIDDVDSLMIQPQVPKCSQTATSEVEASLLMGPAITVGVTFAVSILFCWSGCLDCEGFATNQRHISPNFVSARLVGYSL